MKKVNTIFVMSLFIIVGCGGCKPSGTHSDDFITVDVTASYPKKELILQDFMDVEYIPLETNDDFLCQGFVQAIGKDIIIVRNRSLDGHIFIFDRNGRGLKKLNRKGQSGEVYTNILGITLDE
ncbi:MAG: 6-bladed beta-propeller, partial [Tannerella sp.]|nr:6-bladed beta-propeller [Tannerella sp.]